MSATDTQTTPAAKPEETQEKVTVTEEDDDMPALEKVPEETHEPKHEHEGGHVPPEEPKKAKQSRPEKKSRKAMAKLGMKPVPGIVRVTVKKAKNILFVIAKPDVYKSATADTYVIFGEAKIEDFSSQQLAETAKQFEKKKEEAPAGAQAAPSATEPAEPSEPVDETGIDPKDIELVMSQSSVSRARAVAALRKTKGDIVTAIMELTM
jgi:nascent polypeptide-associated complex subunit alpha